MAINADDFRVTRDHDYPSFLEIQLKNKNKYISKVETEKKHFKRDRWCGWFAAGLLLAVLGITLYQWLVVGAGAMSCVV